jgi:hypothetical protein
MSSLVQCLRMDREQRIIRERKRLIKLHATTVTESASATLGQTKRAHSQRSVIPLGSSYGDACYEIPPTALRREREVRYERCGPGPLDAAMRMRKHGR